MADKPFFPGFEGDDEAKAPAGPAPVPARKPGFNAFADVPVQPPAPGAPASAPAPAAKASAAPPPLPGNDEADIKPGSRKDLWKCPHCGAGNKPDRSTCRACGKSPADAVVIPLWQRPLVRAGALAVIGAIVVMMVMANRVDLSLREPTPANIDRKPRIAGSASGTVELAGGVRLDGDHLISVCGRVAALGRGPGGTTTIALALGPAAMDGHPSATATANGGFTVDGVVLACTSETPIEVKPGQIISLSGVTGTLIKDAAILKEGEGMLAVQVQSLRKAAD